MQNNPDQSYPSAPSGSAAGLLKAVPKLDRRRLLSSELLLRSLEQGLITQEAFDRQVRQIEELGCVEEATGARGRLQGHMLG